MKPNHIFTIGYPADIGGAVTELWHTIRLWRSHGVEVTCIPTWKADGHWRQRLAAIGCKTLTQTARTLSVPAGSVVVAFCNTQFPVVADRLKECRTVWVPCMDYLFDREKEHYDAHGPFDAYVFQSDYQRGTLLPQLAGYGVQPERCHQIHGAFDAEEFPFQPRPHKLGEPFVIGRLSRSDQRKFSRDTWDVYGAVPNVRARVMGWTTIVEQRLGTPPPWAEVLKPGAEASLVFLRSLHALVIPGGEAIENWPRVGLEAMAAGVPIVVEDKGGWREMIEHGATGMLAKTLGEMARLATALARDEGLRLNIAYRARTALELTLANPRTLWGQWNALFKTLT